MTSSIASRIRNFHILFILLGIIMLAAVFYIGNSISTTTATIVEVDLPLQNNISKLRTAIFSQKPILYEYYADTNRENFQKRYNESRKAIKDGLYMLPRDDQGQTFLTQLEQQTAQIDQLSEQLDKTLSSSGIDWDKARDILVEVSATEKKITPLIDDFVSLNQKHIVDLGAHANTSMLIIVGAVAAFILIMLIAALRLGNHMRQQLNNR